MTKLVKSAAFDGRLLPVISALIAFGSLFAASVI